MTNNYGTPAVALTGGSGAVVTDADGREYLDLLGGIAVNILGHRHPAIIEAVTAQLNTLGHTSNLYATEPGVALAEALVEKATTRYGFTADQIKVLASYVWGLSNPTQAAQGDAPRPAGSTTQ